jgi:hypothetical protein
MPFSFDHFVDRSLLERAWHNPELISFLGMVENSVLDFHSDKLSDFSPAVQAGITKQSRERCED